MNNIQKNFKAKRGLCMAQGGLIDQLDPSGQMSRLDLGALTNDPTVLNAAMDREGLAAEQARQAKYPGQTFMNPVAQPQRQAAPVQAAPVQQQPIDRFREPAPTSFEQDNNARGMRIQGYGDQLAGMRKERLGLADGTANVAQAAHPETPEQVMARMAAKYGVSAQPTAAPVQAPQPVAQAPAPQRQGLIGGAMGLLKGRAAQIDRAVNGYAEGGIVRGAGGPTDDEVPMQVAGKDVNLSNSEAVLPVKTVQALGGPEAVEHLIETTNGKPPVRGGLRAGGEYFTGTGGDVIDPRALRPEFRGQAQTPVIQPATNPGLEATRNIRAENAGSKYIDPRATASPQATPTPQAPTQPLPRGEQFGRNAAKVYTDLGGARGVAGKAINALVPAAAALDTMGDEGIRVEGNREGDATNETAGGMTRVANAAKEVGLRAGDWGTKGTDMLMDIPLWAANKAGATSDGKPLEYGLINKNYRQGMRDANLEGVTIPQSTGEQEMLNVKANAEADAFKKKHAAKDGSYGKADQGAIDALKAENAAKKADITLAAVTKAGNFAGQNHIPEAVSPADRVVADSLGGVVDSATGVSRSGDGGLRGMAKRLDTYAKNDAVRGARNMREQLMGSGARFDKGSDGKITITNRGDFDGSTKMAYTGADGNPTAVHEGSQQHVQGLKDAQGLRNQLANFEQMNLKRNAQDDITDIGLRNSSRAALAAQGAQQAELTKARIAKEPSALDLRKDDRAERQLEFDKLKVKQLQGNSDRDAAAAKQEKRLSRYKQLLDLHAPTEGLKDADLLSAQGRRADLQRAFEVASTGLNLQGMNDDAHDTGVNQAVNQARLSVAVQQAMRKDKAGWNFNNVGKNANTTLGVGGLPAYTYDEKNDMLDIGGYKVKGKSVWGDDADLAAFAKTRKSK